MSGPMRVLIVANGEPPSAALITELAASAALVVAADGGAAVALAAGITAGAVVGDLDSTNAALRAQLPAAAFHQDSDPETTDLEKAIRFSISRGATEIDVIAAGGGRVDHAIANFSTLRIFRGQVALRIVDDRFAVSLIHRRASIQGPPGTVVSLIAIGRCTGVTTNGLRWELRDETLEFSPRGIHNEVVASEASVSVASGDLLLFQGRWVEKHT